MIAARPRLGLLLVLLIPTLGVGTSAGAGEDAVELRATRLLEEIAARPDSGIPACYLAEARAITIVPRLVEDQWGIGRRRGEGVHLRRDAQGNWGRPQAVEIRDWNVGAQVGREVSDLVILYQTEEAADRGIREDRTLTISADVSLSLHARHRFGGPKAGDRVKDGTLTYLRQSGATVGARVGAPHRHPYAPGPPAPAPEPPPAPPQPVPPVAGPAASPRAETPLQAVLRTLTSPTPARPGPAGAADPGVRQARTGPGPAGVGR